MNNLFSIALALFFVIDAFGHIPTYLDIVQKVEPRKKLLVAIRELIFALIIMLSFHFLGQWLLPVLSINKNTVQISGGILLFLIALRLIFSQETKNGKKEWGEGNPFIVPIATPLIAGPSVLAAIMIYAQEQYADYTVLKAILLAWFVSSLVYIFAPWIYRLLGEKALYACQRLMGLIVGLIAVQMFMEGLSGLIQQVKL